MQRLDLAAIAADLRAKRGLGFVGVPGRSRPRFLSALRREFTLRAVAQGHSQAAVARFPGIDPNSVARLAQA